MSGSANSYLLDTNILIYYFNGEPPVAAIVNGIIEGQAIGYYCPLTWIELLCYPNLTAPEAQLMREFLRSLLRIDLTESILDQAAEL